MKLSIRQVSIYLDIRLIIRVDHDAFWISKRKNIRNTQVILTFGKHNFDIIFFSLSVWSSSMFYFYLGGGIVCLAQLVPPSQRVEYTHVWTSLPMECVRRGHGRAIEASAGGGGEITK